MRRVPWIVSGASSVIAVITWQVVFISGMHEGLGAGFIGNHFSCLHGHICGCSPTEPSKAALRRRVTNMELHRTEMIQAKLLAIKAAATTLTEPVICVCYGLFPQLCPQGGNLASKGGDFCR